MCIAFTMSKRMNKFKSELKLLATCHPSTARLLFKQAPQEFIRAIVDATWSTLSGKLDLSPSQIDEIRSVQPTLRRIASRGQTFDERRRALSSRRGTKAVQKLFSVIQTQF